ALAAAGTAARDAGRHGAPDAGRHGAPDAAARHAGGSPNRAVHGERALVPATADRVEAAQRLLDARAAAVLHHDAARLVAGVDPGQPELVAGQRRLAGALAGVPLASWRYVVDPISPAPLPAARQRALGPSAWLAEVTLHYALRGFDPRPTTERLYYTFARRGGGWWLAGDADGSAAHLHAARELWDFGPVVAVTGARSLVLGHPAGRDRLATVAAEADRDVPRVTSFWGRRGWSDRVVVLVPADDRELESLVGGQDLSQIAAVATFQGDAGPGDALPGGDRVIVNPSDYADLGRLGRRVVLTHEIIHVATRPVSGPGLPEWLVEGFADYVGFRGTGIAVRAAASELAAGRLPERLPTDRAFDGSAPHLAVAYEKAWLACRYVARRWGERALISLYRSVGTSREPDEGTALRAGLAGVLHVTLPDLTAGWRAYLRAELR
ncbi:MAG: hypothetical protein ACJ74O_18075, partial [Frankiaceae bacterium]